MIATTSLDPGALAGLAGIVTAMGIFLWRVTQTFLTALEKQRAQYIEDQRAERKLAWTAVAENRVEIDRMLSEHRQETNAWLSNHLSGYTRELGRMVDAVSALAKEVDDLKRKEADR
jgi:hypothetical protein